MSDSSRHDWHIIICNGQGGFTSQERGISMCACARVIRCTISFKLEMAGQILLSTIIIKVPARHSSAELRNNLGDPQFYYTSYSMNL